MSASLIERTPSAYDYPLLIKHLLHTPLATAPKQEIVYRDISRYTYRTLRNVSVSWQVVLPDSG